MWEERIGTHRGREVNAAINAYRNGRITEWQLKERLLKNGLLLGEAEEILEHEAEIKKL